VSASAGFLPYGRQDIDDADVAAVVAALKGEYLTTGPVVGAFERALAEAVEAPHAVACANGTAALHMAAMALGLGPGDAVIVPSVTFLATANCARYVGAEVCFADVDPDSGLITAETLAEALSRCREGRPRAVFPVHLAGRTADMTGLAAVAADRGLAVVEDACHALGTSYRRGNATASVGACADSAMACFSFHPVKTATTAEGGAVTTRDPVLAECLARHRSHGMTREPADFAQPDLAFDGAGAANPWYYEMAEPGFNYRLTDLQSALGLSQLRRLPAFASRRRALARRYDEALAPLAPAVRPVAAVPGCNPVLHLYAVLVDFAGLGIERAALMRVLREAGIGTQVHYIPVHLQPYYRRRYGDLDLPGARRYYERCLSLPLFPAMADDDVDRVVEALARALERG